MNKLKTVLPVLLIGNLLCMMDVSIMTIVLPKIQSAFNVSLNDLSWALNIYTILFATMIIPLGRLAVRFGRNRMVLLGLIVFGIGSLMTGNAANLPWMLVGRAIQSIGAASIIPTSMVIGLELSIQENRNKVVAMLAGVQGLAVALGPSVGGFVAQYFGWRWVFLMNVPLVILDIVIFVIVLPLKHEATQAIKIDWLGAGLIMATLFCLSLALIKGYTWGWESSAILGLAGAALLSFIGFIIRERQTATPMIDLSLFKSRNFDGSGLALVLCNFFLGAFAALMPTLLTKVHGESELNAALKITPYSVAVMLSVILTSLLVKRLNNKLLVGTGFAMIAGSYWLITQLPVTNQYTKLIVGEICLGIGYGLVAATVNILVVADFHGVKLTDSQSVANVLRQVGMILSIAVFMSLLSSNVQTAKNQTLTYSHRTVSRLNVTQTVKTKANQELARKFKQNTNSNSQVNQHVAFAGVTVSTAKRQQAVQKATKIELSKVAMVHQIPVTMIPTAQRHQVQTAVTTAVNRTIDHQVRVTNQQLKLGVNRIRRRLTRNLNNAFLKTLQVIIPLALLSILVVVTFKFRD
ncbi:MFS transporter [Lactiplantibacillus nangangensis]|uniref:MFS transporter n=1 Tax=Lactiplantibacillus nangangensis TaxID=2559917 RepID=A0ABW1SJQ1_9LACO|nr:MFS transporter [Lactiplantibacillus nangangensis]